MDDQLQHTKRSTHCRQTRRIRSRPLLQVKLRHVSNIFEEIPLSDHLPLQILLSKRCFVLAALRQTNRIHLRSARTVTRSLALLPEYARCNASVAFPRLFSEVVLETRTELRPFTRAGLDHMIGVFSACHREWCWIFTPILRGIQQHTGCLFVDATAIDRVREH